MERKISLNGTWNLYRYDGLTQTVQDPAELSGLAVIPAQVPGNVELDLIRAGMLPEDLFKGTNIRQAEQYETCGWWYTRTFDAPETRPGEKVYLTFEGVDCEAVYFLNGARMAESDNAFIPHETDVTALLRPGENTLAVHLPSSVIRHFNTPNETYLLHTMHIVAAVEQRKPAHSYGWDIFPRAVTAGLWKDVSLSVRDGYEFEEVYYTTWSGDLSHPRLRFYFSINAPIPDLLSGELEVRIHGKCGDSEFFAVEPMRKTKINRKFVRVDNPKLWWPYGYGEPNVYDTTLQLCRGDRVLAEHKLNVGIRRLELINSNVYKDGEGTFRFRINEQDMMVKGSNWVPLDPYHSRDKARYAPALALVSELGCNMLRVWGGGVYEQDEFYDYCDRHGILIWQDFMMACEMCPMTPELMKNMEQELTWVIKHLRNHPCIALWAGDNEIDCAFAGNGANPDVNEYNRTLMPKLTMRYDPFRPFLPSSPYVPGEYYKNYRQNGEQFTESHLWGSREYYKSTFYTSSKAAFISEIGYPGCPSPESMKQMLDAEYLWPPMNEQWSLHSSDQNGLLHRIGWIWNQVCQFFDFEPDNLADFSLASQISQAEAMKFFVERMRTGRPDKTGILCWNLLDGWPEATEAAVDYYFRKKLAFYYLKQAQAPTALMLGEMDGWSHTLYVANDTLHPVSGTYAVTDIETGEEVVAGTFDGHANATTRVREIRVSRMRPRMLLIRWTVDGKTSYNHYLCGMPSYDFAQYKGWLEKLRVLYGVTE